MDNNDQIFGSSNSDPWGEDDLTNNLEFQQDLISDSDTMEQTKNYEEEGVPDDTSSSPQGLSKKTIMIIAGGIVLIAAIVIIVCLSLFKKNTAKKEEAKQEQAKQEQMANNVFNEPGEMPAEPELDENGNPIEQQPPAPVAPVAPLWQDFYNDEQKETLRELGFTGYEIETFMEQSMDYETIVKDALAQRNQWMEKARKDLYKGSGKKFKKMYNLTWLGQKKQSDKNFSMEQEYYTAGFATFNANYIKVGVYGHQCWLKVSTDPLNKTWSFITVTPWDYTKLATKKGNVVLDFDYCTAPDGTVIYNSIKIKEVGDR